MKPVLLIYPPYEGRTILKSRLPFPIGPLYIASYLESKGMSSMVMDFGYPQNMCKATPPMRFQLKQRYIRFGWEDGLIYKWLMENLKKNYSPRFVGVSSLMSSNYNGAYRVMELIHKVAPDLEIITGGPHATAFPDHVAKYSKADFVCIGEGEDQFYNFLSGNRGSSILSNREIIGMRSIDECYSKRGFIKDLDSLPFMKRSFLIGGKERKFSDMMVTFGRGCPHKCSFCGSHLIQGRMWRHKSVSRVVEELKFLNQEWEVRSFLVEDDNLCPGTKGVEWLKELCVQLIPLKFKFHVPHGIPVYATADKELCDLLWRSGFKKMVFPLESTNVSTLQDMNKEFTVDNWKLAIGNWSYEKAHYPTEIIIGYPFVDTIGTMLNTIIDVAYEGALIWASHFRLNKGTPLFDRCVEAKMVGNDFDPINTQGFFLKTDRFTLSELKELSAIAKGFNFATEFGVNIIKWNFRSEGELCGIVFKGLLGNCFSFEAKGNFKFRRGQSNFLSILFAKAGYKQKPILNLTDDTAHFTGWKSSSVQEVLSNKISGSGTVFKKIQL